MSWEILNRILGQASIDPLFRQAIQQNPLQTLQNEGLELTPDEQRFFIDIAPLPFPEFCHRLSKKLTLDEQSESNSI
ncbi:Os1348 family NHLP clan protein [Tengunoibacter tsumagoiensis]|uniref:Extradiol ring-cleavage dioxygenase LigAB LigA subunit domain-containing protein n=1 Tax=Tengunoibacter tsumagoiensis TaxID=2014871 RepID=A0A402A8Y0_9CHLR|nr:Os1348 family NHLP clan protein [Tengunoibacter tsumagoiensis]GCE15610.1 hypothetical protein KTT_54690 [Tengunoibacter tsumagoiensis]